MRIRCEGPYDFRLSWRMLATFAGQSASERGSLAMWWEDRPTSVLLNQTSLNPPVIELIADPLPQDARRFGECMHAVLNADLALEPFYRKARRNKTLRPIVNALIGLKPFRPPDLFQMLVIALTEQQISLAAAASIRDRLVSSHGARVGRLMAFPRPGDLARLSVEELAPVGLSRRKAEYLIELAGKMAAGELDDADWRGLSDDEVAALLRSHRGIGEWTAEYILVRGLGRMNVFPANDLGIRRAVGTYMAGGREVTAAEVREILQPWSPWRGLLAFYLLAYQRMSQMGLDQAQ